MQRLSRLFLSNVLRFGWIPVLIMVFLSACQSMPAITPSPPVPAAAPADPALDVWQEGLAFFEKGEYEKALLVFETVHENAQTEILRYRALFKVAAVHLILAQTPEDYGQALNKWEQWSAAPTPEGAALDPRVLTPFFKKLDPPNHSDAPRDQIEDPEDRRVKNNAYTNYLVCRENLRSRERELEKLKANLMERNREIRNLRRQINSLEEIHLRFQEMKQEVSTP